MIILSGVLVVLAIVLLVTGIVTGNTGHEIAGLDGLKLIYVSIGISIVSALFLAVGVFMRWKELFGTAASQAPAKSTASTRRTARSAKTKARVGASEETQVMLTSPTVTDVPGETTVWVVPGRKRYHLDTCRQLAGRDKEELTYVEAREEGFTACTACLPDTALAARAAVTDANPATERPADSATVPAESGMDGSSITRTDIPITAHMPVIEEPETSPAELVEQPETSGLSESATDPHAEATKTSEATEAPEYETGRPSQPARQSRSFFEPLDRAVADEDTADGDETPTSEPYAPEDTTQDETVHEAAHEPEDAAPRRSDDEPASLSEDEEPADESGPDAHTAESDTEQPTADDDAGHDDAADDLADDTTATGHDDDHGTGSGDTTAESGDDVADSTASDADGGSDTLTVVRILSGTKRYHRPDCALIEDIADDDDDLETLPSSEAKSRGCTPCLVCQPDKDSPDAY